MKRCTLLVLFLGLIASRTAMAQTICAGAEASSTACATPCSGTVVNDEVVGGSNAGKFNVGNGNQGDGNDGFNNVGNFNVGSGNSGNCNLASGGTVGNCDVGNSPGRIAINFCNVYPTDPKCTPSGYLPEFSQALRSQIASVVASCNGGPPATPLSPLAPTPPAPQSATAAVEAANTPPPVAAAPEVALGVVEEGKLKYDPKAVDLTDISDSTVEPKKLLGLLAQHIKQENAAGRKML